jgi:hypothetical protein
MTAISQSVFLIALSCHKAISRFRARKSAIGLIGARRQRADTEVGRKLTMPDCGGRLQGQRGTNTQKYIADTVAG